MHRRTFLGTALAAALDAQSSDIPLPELTLDAIGAAFRSGRWTARSLAQAYLRAIAGLDQKLHSVIELNPAALADADALDRERRAKGPRGPLHGVPILLKDNIDTAGPLHTSAGSLALASQVAARDAFAAARLRAAGALILGKTNLSEWANFRSTQPVSGWSGRGGQTHCPYALDRNPSGSSSGSAVAVSANLCAVAVGTETDGSIIGPSSVNGIVGIKPTLGLVSRAGIVPIAHSQDTAGPMARTVRDAAILLGALAGPDPSDPATAAGRFETDYTRYLDPRGLRGARLGVARKFFESHAGMNRLLDDWVQLLKHEGAEVIDPADLPAHGKWSDPEFQVLLYEFKADLDAYLGALPSSAPVHSLADVIRFNEQHRDTEMPYFGQEIMLQAQKKGPLSEPLYHAVRAACLRFTRQQGIDAVVKEHCVDAIVAPSSGPACLIDWVNGDQDTGGCTSPAAIAGYPHITVPAGFVRGLPVGLSFFGPAWSEPVLLRLAYAFEQAGRFRRPPSFLPTVEFR